MSARLAGLVRNLVLLAALLSLAVASAPVAWHLGGFSDALPPASLASAAAARATSSPVPAELDPGPILDLAPFGAVEMAPPPVTAAAEVALSATALALVLQGVVLRDDPSLSTAFISHEGDTAGYRPGDDVAGQALLLEVAARHVVVEVDGERQVLTFPGKEVLEAMGAVDEPATDSGPDRLRELVASQTTTPPGVAAAPPPAAAALLTTQDHIAMWRERIRANPAEVLDRIGLIPGPEGYRVAEDHDSGVGLAGLQAGDVIRSVNGQAVGDVESDTRFFDEVAASRFARVEVARGDRTLTLSFPLE